MSAAATAVADKKRQEQLTIAPAAGRGAAPKVFAHAPLPVAQTPRAPIHNHTAHAHTHPHLHMTAICNQPAQPMPMVMHAYVQLHCKKHPRQKGKHHERIHFNSGNYNTRTTLCKCGLYRQRQGIFILQKRLLYERHHMYQMHIRHIWGRWHIDQLFNMSRPQWSSCGNFISRF